MEESGDKTNQNCVFTLTPFAVLAQQSPPSNWQPQLLRENARGISWSGVQRIVRTTHVSNQPKSSLVLFITITISFVVREFAKALAVRVATS